MVLFYLLYLINISRSITNLQFLHFRLLLDVNPSEKELQLEKKAKSIEQEACQYDLPSTFMKWAAMKREGARIEREIFQLQEKRVQVKSAVWRQQLSRALQARTIVIWALVFFVIEAKTEPAPLFEFASAWTFPFGRLLAIPNYSSGAVSAIGWTVLCQRFFGRIFQ